MKAAFFAAAVLAAGSVFSSQHETTKYDPKMMVKDAIVTNGVKWIDGTRLPIEGREFDDVARYYDRLPNSLTTNVNAGVRGQLKHSSGMLFRFKTDSKKLSFKWKPLGKKLEMDHMPATGVSGIDVYRWDEPRGKWLYVATGRIYDPKLGRLSIPWMPGDKCIVNLPLYNGIETFSLGIDPEATLECAGPRTSGVEKPVVFYGTSITHGGCASRPGLGFVNIVGRRLDVPVTGLGFSGSGVMEYELSDVIARIDASCYVLDCIWNMDFEPEKKGPRSVQRNYEPFIRNLRAKRPGVPIVMAGACDVFCGAGKASAECKAMDGFLKALYDKLVAEGWRDLWFLPHDGMLGDDFEGTVDGVHPNDIGMARMGEAYAAAVAKALGLKMK